MIAAAPPELQRGIAVSGVSMSFEGPHGSVQALQDVSFTVQGGEFCAAIGPSGCGKTTLLHILAGLLVPTAGQVTVPKARLGHLAIAVVFQGVSTLPWMSALHNVEYGLRLLGTPAPVRRGRALDCLRQVGLEKFADAYPYQLSEGMRQRVSIARALATDPDVLLLDEPFANLDEQNRLLLQDDLLDLWHETKKTVLFVTHSLDEAVRLADRVLVMSASPGRIKAEVRVPLQRPREFDRTRTAPAYGALIAQLWDELRGEVSRAQGHAP